MGKSIPLTCIGTLCSSAAILWWYDLLSEIVVSEDSLNV